MANIEGLTGAELWDKLQTINETTGYPEDARGNPLTDRVLLDANGNVVDGQGNIIAPRIQTEHLQPRSQTYTITTDTIDITFTSTGRSALLYISRVFGGPFVMLSFYINSSENVNLTVIGRDTLTAENQGNLTLRIGGLTGATEIYINTLSGNAEIASIADA